MGCGSKLLKSFRAIPSLCKRFFFLLRFAHPLGEDDSHGPWSYRSLLPSVNGKVTVGDDELTANYRVEQHVEVVEERDRDRKLLRLLSECHNSRYAFGGRRSWRGES